MTQDPKTGEKKVWPRKEWTDFIYVVSFPYIMTLVEAETLDNLPVTVMFQLRIRIVNPFKALFDTENWMDVVSGAAIGAARNFVGSKTYAELVSERKLGAKLAKDAADSFSTLLVELNEQLPGLPDGYGLHREYGAIVEGADVQSISLAGERAGEILEATVKAYTADQNAYATEKAGQADASARRAIGTADADVIRLKAVAEADGLTAKLAAWNNGGRLNALIVQMEAMKAEGAGTKVIWANNPFVQSMDGLAELLDKLGFTSIDDLKAAIGKQEESV
jgi:regulator of protease activity HflC (stomatin/prohibitin superfamily)